MSKELFPLVIYQTFKSKYLAKYEFSTGETLTYDVNCISLYSLLGYILFHCYYTAVACKNSHGVSMAYKFSMAYFSRTVENNVELQSWCGAYQDLITPQDYAN